MKIYLLVINIVCLWSRTLGQPSAEAQLQSDTILFGQYYINRGLANMPLILLYDKHRGKEFERVENGREYLIELKAGRFDQYAIDMQALSNGKVYATNKKNHFRLGVNQRDNSGVMELGFIYRFNQDKIYIKVREWADQPNTISAFDSVSTMYVPIH